MDPREIKPLIYTPNSYIVEFDFDGKKEQAVLREAQFHPVREQILHLDFYRIADGKPVSIAIPVRLTGNAEGVKVGGKLALSARKLVVSALVENLPDELVVDVTTLGVGKTIFVGDLKFENLKFVTPATTAVCAVRVTRASRGAAAAEISPVAYEISYCWAGKYRRRICRDPTQHRFQCVGRPRRGVQRCFYHGALRRCGPSEAQGPHADVCSNPRPI